MGNSEGLMEVHVADVSPEEARGSKTDLGIHISAVHVDLPSVLVDHLAHLLHSVLVLACSGGESNHVGPKLIFVLQRFLSEVLHVHSPVLHLHHNHLEAC